MGTSVTVGLTQDSLGIFWEGEEVPGIAVYGYYSPVNLQEPQFPSEAWPPGTLWSPWALHGENWIIWVWDIRVDQWPRNDRWREAIAITLGALRTSGARVAWCGVNGIFAEPPHLFDPARMSGVSGPHLTVVASCTDRRRSILHSKLSVMMNFLSCSDRSACHTYSKWSAALEFRWTLYLGGA